VSGRLSSKRNSPMADPSIGTGTCSIEAQAGNGPSSFEALGYRSGFCPSTLGGALVGGSELASVPRSIRSRADMDSRWWVCGSADYLATLINSAAKVHSLGLGT